MPLVYVDKTLALADPNTPSGAAEAANVDVEVVLDGTATRVPLFQDADGQTPLAQPIRTGARGVTQDFYAQVDALNTKLAWRSGGLQGGRIWFEGYAADTIERAAADARETLNRAAAALQNVDRIAEVPGMVAAAEGAAREAGEAAGRARTEGRDAAIETLTTQPGIIETARTAVSAAADDLELVEKETTDAEGFSVRYDDGEPFVQADESRGIHSTRIEHLPETIPPSATTFVEELEDSQGWAWVVRYEDGEIAYGQRRDGTHYPEASDLRPGSVGAQLLAPEVTARLWPARTGSPVVVWGDSRSAAGSGYGPLLSTLLGVPVVVDAVGGQGSDQIAARQGGRPARVKLSGDALPASGPVTLTVDIGLLDRPSGGSLFTRRGSIAGVPGILSCDNSTGAYSFTRDVTGQAQWVSPGTAFVPENGASGRASVQLILSGRNSIHRVGWTPTMILDTVLRMVEYANAPGGRVLVLEDFPGRQDTLGSDRRARLDEYTALLKERTPVAFVPTGPYLINRAMSDLGLTPTPDDQADIAAGVVPRSIMPDGVHLNDAGNTALAQYVAREITTRGLI